MIRSYQAEHGGTVFYSGLSRRQKAARKRLAALMVIAVVAASAGLVQAFDARSASMEGFALAQNP